MTDTAESTTMPTTKPVESVSTESSAPPVAAASTSSTPTPAPAPTPTPQLPTTSSTSSPLSSSDSSAKKDDATASKKRPAESTTDAASPKEASVTTSDVSTAAAKTATTTTTTPSSTEPEAPAKRAKTDDSAAVAGVSSTSSNNTPKTKSSTGIAAAAAATTTAATASTEDLLDLAVTLGYEAGDRLQVQWEIDTPGKESFVKWWAATLLDFDGRTVDEVAIRQIHYEACPEMGFLDESIDDVVFLGDDLLVSPDRTTQLTYRRMKRTTNGAEDSDDNEEDAEQDDIFWYNESDMDEQLNTILMGALTKNERVWKSLEPAKQAHIADQIRIKKARLLEVLRSQKQVITSENIPAILQQAFGSRRA